MAYMGISVPILFKSQTQLSCRGQQITEIHEAAWGMPCRPKEQPLLRSRDLFPCWIPVII